MSYYRLLGLPLALGVILFSGVYIYIHATTATPPDQNQPSKTATSTSAMSSSTPEVTLPPLAEQVGRLFIIGHWAGTPIASTTALIQQYHVGGVIIMSAPEDPNDIKGWIKEWQGASDVPLMIAIDQEGGTVSRLKGPDFIQTAQPDIVNAEQAFSVAKQRGAELAAFGINTNFAPVIETSVNPAGFLYERTFRDPDLIPLLGKAMLNGYSASGITGVIKHYPGHEDEPADSHITLPIVQLAGTTFREHTSNFNELIGYGLVKAIMTAHVLIPSIEDILHTPGLRDIKSIVPRRDIFPTLIEST